MDYASVIFRNVENPTMEDCCDQTRKLDYVRDKHDELMRENSSRRPKCADTGETEKAIISSLSCGPNLPPYPCRGVIKAPRKDLNLFADPKESFNMNGPAVGQSESANKPINGWEFINANKTCDLYPIDSNLPSRFNNPLWFKVRACDYHSIRNKLSI